MAHLGNTIVNGALRVLGGANIDTINGVTVGNSPKFTDNNTTYSAGAGISLSGTTFTNSGVRSIAQGTTNGTVNVNTNGSTADVAVKGLAALAYKASLGKSDVGLGSVANLDQSKAIKSITRSGTTFTATALDGTTSTFTQQDNNTTYTGANGVSLSGTTFSNSGVRSMATGTTNGTINVNTNGSTADVAVKGLGAMAYKASVSKSDVGLGNVTNYDQAKAIKSITRSGTTFTATALDGTTTSFTQQDNNTTYTGANGVSLSGTTFSNSGVRAIATGTTAGTINVNTNGSTANIAVKDAASAIKNITRSGTTFTATKLDGSTFSFTQQDNNTTYSNATTAAAGLMAAADKVKLNGIQTGANTMSKKRYTITASSWSSSASGGYYSYTLTLSSPTLNTGYPPNVYLSGSADSTAATAAEQTAYALLDYCNLTAASTLMLYAATKPTTTFYVYVEGVSA